MANKSCIWYALYEVWEPEVFECALDQTTRGRRNCLFPGSFVVEEDSKKPTLQPPGNDAEIMEILAGEIGCRIEFGSNVYGDDEARYETHDVVLPSWIMKEGIEETYLVGLTTVIGDGLYRFSFPVFSSSACAIAHANRTGNLLHRTSKFLHPFDLKVWLAFFTVIIIQKLIIHIWRYSNFQNHFGVDFKMNSNFKSLSLVNVWMALFVALLIGLYRTSLLSSLLFSEPSFMFDDTESLLRALEGGDVRTFSLLYAPNYIEADYLTDVRAQTFDRPIFRRLNKTLTNRPSALHVDKGIYDAETSYKIIKENNYVMVTECGTAQYYVMNDCGLRYMPIPEMMPIRSAYLLNAQRLNRRVRASFDNAIVRMQAAIEGIARRYERIIEQRTSACRNDDHNYSSKRQPIRLFNMIGVAFLHVTGMLSGAICLIGEIIRRNFRMKRRLF